MHANAHKVLVNQYGETNVRRPSRRELMDDFFDSLEDTIQEIMANEAEEKFYNREGAL